MLRRKHIYILLATVGLVGLVGLVGFTAKHYQPTTAADLCDQVGATHRLVISKGSFTPTELTVKRCDRIEVINQDAAARRIALGEHDNHAEYPGFKEQSLGQGNSFTFTAGMSGHYHIHDHIHDSVQADITIK